MSNLKYPWVSFLDPWDRAEFRVQGFVLRIRVVLAGAYEKTREVYEDGQKPKLLPHPVGSNAVGVRV